MSPLIGERCARRAAGVDGAVENGGSIMARPDPATGVRSVFAGRLGRTMTLIVLAILAIAGVALTFGSGKPRTKPREGRTIIAQQIGQTIATPAVSTFELTDCEPLESEELAATAPSR